MKKDSATKKEYSLKKLNKIMGYVLFGTAFLMSFLFIDKSIRANHWIIVISVFAGAIVVEIIVWIILYFTFKKKQLTENDKNIQKAIEEIRKEQEKTLSEREKELYNDAEEEYSSDEEQEVINQRIKKQTKAKTKKGK